ncbi:WbuC family cupin fold metalloprotein [Bradyrhizobium sp. CSS354]|uniref:WbuC family cupin fold metalloprotein n=1 Tax=Bradyrhizobium sp. CSS354 TaxID=2699172 RepID=UPI0023AED39E|nr:WbuC family cupin fold metalloprotein [Bradyrhizobium sp. CSS354]MDE5460180.1 cupin fold metalloprotein, WbuC family [Bradyrhizobium sp. CSS354]
MGSSSSNEATGLRRPASLRAQNPEVYYSDDAIVTADDATIAELKRIAAGNPRLRSRLCTHPEPSSDLHEMLIVHQREAYVRPHKHFGKPESFHLIEGTAQVVIFEDDGRIRDVLDMAPYGRGALCYYRMPEQVFHSILITSEWLVFHETTAGPFDPSRTAFPDWAPDGGDVAEVQNYVTKVGALATEHLAHRHTSRAIPAEVSTDD